MGIRWDKLVVRTRMFAVEHKRMLLIIAIIAAIILLGIFGTKIYLVMKVVLGHDVIVRLSGNATHLSLENGQSQSVTFETSVVTNPFCAAECSSRLYDISRDLTLAEESFSINPQHPYTTGYTFMSQHLGEGQELYRFSVTCQGLESTLCHTTAEPVTRNVIVTLDHTLNTEEIQVKGIFKERLDKIAERNSRLQSLQKNLEAVGGALDTVTPMENELEKLNHVFLPELAKVSELWENQDYESLEPEINHVEARLDAAEANLIALNKTIIGRGITYNVLLSRLKETEEILTELEDVAFAMGNTSELNEAILSHNGAVFLFTTRTPMPEKQNAALGVHSSILSLNQQLSDIIEKKTLTVQLGTDISTDALCQLRGVCIDHPDIVERSLQEEFDLLTSCSSLATLSALHHSLTSTGELGNVTYSTPEWRNISSYTDTQKKQITDGYLVNLPNGSLNEDLIREILDAAFVNQTIILPPGNLTPALTIALTQSLPESCDLANVTLPRIANISLQPLPLDGESDISPVLFEEQQAMCCVFGECKRCCDTGECSPNPPLLFIHGHAFNKDTSAEYSLDIFNEVQSLLEEEGFLNGGIISITAEASPYGIFGRVDSQWSFKGSYYFDAFEEEGSYNIVHTKSENIDTYAIRLKERIDTIMHLTGQDQVVIIAHSMGGLVARRYVQIFGSEHVERLILVGSPNTGIAGSVADFCPIVGEKLECRDMQEKSLFLNKLNRESNSVLTEVIIGKGCSMEGGDGDGIVTVTSAQLEGANAQYIDGSCTTLEPLHTELFNIEEYPEMYSTLLSSLR